MAAIRIISAPFACIGKFISERAFTPGPIWRRQPKTVCISFLSRAEVTMSSDQDQNRR
jgi:hypothetical protein